MLARPGGVALTASGRPVPSDEYQDLIHTVNATLFPAGPDVLGRVLRNGVEEDAADMRIPARVLDLLNEPANGPLFESILPGGL